jgi:RHH-type transcriptional regulator, rel operon repressor / antitoxin RelB
LELTPDLFIATFVFMVYMYLKQDLGEHIMGSTKQMSVRVPTEIFKRLEFLSKKTGRTSTFYLREALEEHLDDLEDIYLAEHALKRLQQGQEQILSNEEFWRGLDD